MLVHQQTMPALTFLSSMSSESFAFEVLTEQLGDITHKARKAANSCGRETFTTTCIADGLLGMHLCCISKRMKFMISSSTFDDSSAWQLMYSHD